VTDPIKIAHVGLRGSHSKPEKGAATDMIYLVTRFHADYGWRNRPEMYRMAEIYGAAKTLKAAVAHIDDFKHKIDLENEEIRIVEIPELT
jgi:hypothetical protein